MTVSFFILAALTIAGTAAAMSLRNLVHCVLALTLGFAGLAALYLQLGAQFVGFTQILVYVGAVAILVVFAILLTQSAGPTTQPVFSSVLGDGQSSLLAASLRFWPGRFVPAAVSRKMLPPEPEATVQQIGDALMHTFALPLEIIGLLLTVALIGAVMLAMHEKQEMR